MFEKLLGRSREKVSPLDAELNEVLATLPKFATEQHTKYRAGRMKEDGSYNPRFKTLSSADAQWIKQHPDRIGKDPALGEHAPDAVDIAAYEYLDLPPSRQEDSVASIRTAHEAVYRAKKNGTEINEAFINRVADTIHEQWLMRNGDTCRKEIAALRAVRGYKTDEEALADPKIADLMDQLEPYSKLTETNKELDRKFVREAITAYDERHPSETPHASFNQF